MRRRGLLLVYAAASMALALEALPGHAADSPTTSVAVAGRSNADASIAARDEVVVLTWAATSADGATDVFAAASRDGGRIFGAPQRVNDVAGEAKITGEQPPHVVLVPHGSTMPAIVVVWTARGAIGTRLLWARSDDGGRSFTHAAPVPGSDAPGNRGWEATTVDAKGRVLGIWLDHRELADATGASTGMTHNHAHDAGSPPRATGSASADGSARAQASKLYFARLGDDRAQPITGGVCYCCRTALATGRDGAIYAAWRHVYPGNVRDIAITVSRDQGRSFSPPARVSEDRWALDGCPENGPALAVDGRNVVHVVWPTLVRATTGAENLALFYATSRDGRQFSPRRRIPTDGTPRHPQVAIAANGAVVVAWDEEAHGTRRVVAASLGAAEATTLTLTRLPLAASARAEYPAIAVTNAGIAIAWTSGLGAESAIQIQRLNPPAR